MTNSLIAIESQKIFKQSYLEALKRGVREGKLIHLYQNDVFEIADENVLWAQNIIKPSKVILKTPTESANFDFENAKILFESYKNLTPLQASDVRLWTYLAHADFYEYMCRRWPKAKNGSIDNKSSYILKYWFVSSPSQANFITHGIAGLWWIAYLTYDETRSDKYELTKLIFRTLDVPTRTLGAYNLSRHKEAVIGIMEYVGQNPNLFKDKYQEKMRFVTKYLNQLGGTKPISYFNRDFFKKSLATVSDKIAIVN